MNPCQAHENNNDMNENIENTKSVDYRKQHIKPLIKSLLGIILYSIPLYFAQVYLSFIMSNFVFIIIAGWFALFFAFALVISILIFMHSFFCIILNTNEIGIG
jgi:polyferredoxin